PASIRPVSKGLEIGPLECRINGAHSAYPEDEGRNRPAWAGVTCRAGPEQSCGARWRTCPSGSVGPSKRASLPPGDRAGKPRHSIWPNFLPFQLVSISVGQLISIPVRQLLDIPVSQPIGTDKLKN